MNKTTLASLLLRYVAPLVLFFGLSAVYFAPQFEGRSIVMHDVVQYKGMSQSINEHRAEYGEDPQWTGSMFGGMPAYLISIEYPSQVVKGSVGRIADVIAQPASFIFLAMAAFWLMLLMWGVGPWAAVAPALAYGLSTYFFLIIGAGHVTKMLALAYAPLMVGGVFLAFRRNMWLGGAVTALFTSLEIGANHPQISYYFLLVMAAYWISELVKAVRNGELPRFVKTTAVVAAAGLLGVGSNFAQLYYTAEHTPETIRGGSVLAEAGDGGSGLDLDYATAWSYGRTESLNMLVPDLMGRESGATFAPDGAVAQALKPYGLEGIATQLPMYWGDQPYTAGPTYLGAVAVFLAVLGLFLTCGRNRWWILGVSVLAILLAWGSNMMWFTKLCFDILPGYDKFRTVSMILVIVEWTVPFAAALALAALCRGGVEAGRLRRALLWSLGIAGGLCLALALFGRTLLDFGHSEALEFMTQQWKQMLSASGYEQAVAQGLHVELGEKTADAMALERARLMTSDAWRSTIFIAIAALAVWGFAKGKLKAWALAAVMSVLVVADMVPVNLRFLPQSKFVKTPARLINPTAADVAIMADDEPGFRVLNRTVSPFNDATTSYFHRSVGGYHGAKLSRYQDLIDHALGMGDREVLNMLNTKYEIVQGASGPEARLNPESNGAAWLVESVVWAPTPAGELAALLTLDTRREAVAEEMWRESIDGKFGAPAEGDTIVLAEYRDNYLKYDYEAAGPRLAIFSEIFYDKGWSATIDGEEAPVLRADYLLRAMVLPEGHHTVEFRFRAPRFGTVSGVTLACSLLVLVWAAAALVYALKRNKKHR